MDQHLVAVAAGDDEVLAVGRQRQRRQGHQADAVQRLLDDLDFQLQMLGGEEEISFGEGFGGAAELVGELLGVGGDAVELGQQHQAEQAVVWHHVTAEVIGHVFARKLF